MESDGGRDGETCIEISHGRKRREIERRGRERERAKKKRKKKTTY